MRWWAVAGLVFLFVVRVDIWWWNDASQIGALPIGLAYHVLYCFAVTAFFLVLVKRCWPAHLDTLDSSGEQVRVPKQ